SASRGRQEEEGAERGAGGGRGVAPPALSGIAQRAAEGCAEPKQVQNRQAQEDRGDQDPRAIAVVERAELVGRRADFRLIAINDPGDDEENGKLDAGTAPKTLPVRALEHAACLPCGRRRKCPSPRPGKSSPIRRHPDRLPALVASPPGGRRAADLCRARPQAA